MWPVIIVLVILVTIIVRWSNARHSVFKRSGIIGPRPIPLFGSLIDFMFTNQPIPLMYPKWCRIYGKTFGYYEGAAPVLVTSDVEILDQVLVKQFANFHGRQEFPLRPDADNDQRTSMFNARGRRWKRLRTISSPKFSTGNIKNLMPLLNSCTDALVEKVLKECEGRPIDMHGKWEELTLDVITRVVFGYKGSTEKNPYLDDCREEFAPKAPLSTAMALLAAQIFPEIAGPIRDLLTWYKRVTGERDPRVNIDKLLKAAIAERRKTMHTKSITSDRMDFIDLFLEGEAEVADDDCELLDIGKNGRTKFDIRAGDVEKRLSTEEMVHNLMLFLFAGYDTTSNALAYSTYLLATNDKIQSKLLAELDSANLTSSPTYDDMQKLTYLDWVMKETLRMYPMSAFAVTRECMSDCVIAGVQIAKGVAVAADVWSVQYDKEIWGDDAEEFRPERWNAEESAGRSAVAWLPFGSGPKACIGQRLAHLEYKLAMAKMLMRHKFVKCPETKVPLVVHGARTASPTDVFVEIQQRK